MATTKGDEEQLAINIVAKLTDLEKQMAKANGITAKAYREMSLSSRKATKQMEDDAIRSSIRTRQAMASVSTSVGTMGKAFAAASAAFIGVNQVIAASQAYIRAENALKVAGKAGDDLTKTFERLYGIAQDNSTPIETLVGLYSKASQASSSLKASEDQLMAFTTATAQALRVQGKSAEESSGALLQLGQAISGSKVQAEEYNSLIDGAYPLLQAAAAGLKEAGGEVSKLTALVKDGKVSSAAFFNAVIAGAPVLEQKLAGAQKTVAQAGTEFSNAMIGLVGAIDKAVGATPKVAGALSSGSKQIETATGFVNDLAAAYERLSKAMPNKPGYTAYGTAPGGIQGGGSDWYNRTYGSATPTPSPYSKTAQELADLQKQVAAEQARQLAEASNPNALMKAYDGTITAPTPKVKPVSLGDYPVTGDAKKKTEDDYERERRQIQENTKALELEVQMVGKSTYERQYAIEKLKLETAAKREGKTITTEMAAEIDKEAAANAKATVVLEKANEARQDMQALQRFAGESISSFFSDIISGGENAEKALMNLVKRLADAALQASLLGDGPLASLFGTKGSNGNVGGLIGSVFSLFSADGNAFTAGGVKAFAKGGVVNSPTMFGYAGGLGVMGERDAEAIMPLQRDASGRLGVRAQGGRSSAPISISVAGASITIQGNADQTTAAEMKRFVEQQNRELPARVVAAVRDAQARGKI